jgi:hypothetical protein
MTCKTKLTPAARKARSTARTAGGTFYATAGATIAANMYASEHTFVGLATGFWAPAALFLSLELMERVPLKGRAGLLRKVGVGVIALIAAWVSYWHLVHLFKVGGADPISAHAMPLTVDVLMAIARGAMVTKAPSRPAVRRPAAKAKAPERKLKAV